MQTKLLHKYFFCLLFTCVCTTLKAQNSYQYKAQLDKVSSAGFYKIVLLPSVTARLQPGFQDIRILDAEGKQVPYILRSNIPSTVNYPSLHELPILSNKKESDKLTHVVVDNNLKRAISSLVLFIKNTVATRYVTIAGSDTNKDWFVIKEGVTLSNLFADDSETIAQELHFPNSKYRYFKLIIHGENELPINIIKVCSSNHGANPDTNFIPIPSPSIQQKNSSDHASYVTLRFDDLYPISKISLEVSGGRFYKRTLHIYNKGALLNYHTSLFLSSNAPAVYPVAVKTDELLLKIFNEDNPPLRVIGVSAFQLEWYLLTWLEEGSGYNIIFGDSTAKAPVYDLAFFKDSVKHTPLSLQYGSTEKNRTSELKEPGGIVFNKVVMWGVIVVVLSLLLFFTFRLTKDISGKE